MTHYTSREVEKAFLFSKFFQHCQNNSPRRTYGTKEQEEKFLKENLECE